MEQNLLTKEQGLQILNTIENNFQWTRDKGCNVHDSRKFIEAIICRLAGIELEDVEENEKPVA